MKKSAASHGGAALISMIIGPVLAEAIKPGFPGIYRFFERIGVGISDFVNSIFRIHTHPMSYISIFFILLIGVVWGMFYGLIRHRTIQKYGQR
ncbi:MAG: hypothetical protein KAR14_07395 [Candidatus Aminicenantes bacterium]|nr:hypothetical protein [Candidatus Aminicenantes bacterium]